MPPVRVIYAAAEGTEGACSVLSVCRSVAQPGSAPQWGCGGRRFKSSRSDQKISLAFLRIRINRYDSCALPLNPYIRYCQFSRKGRMPVDSGLIVKLWVPCSFSTENYTGIQPFSPLTFIRSVSGFLAVPSTFSSCCSLLSKACCFDALASQSSILLMASFRL